MILEVWNKVRSFDNTWENIHATQEWGKYPTEAVIRFVARNYYSKEREKIKILDFGCGGGSHTWYLAREGFDVYAFDGSPSAVERVRKRLEQEGLTAQLRVRDALELDYEKNLFDCVIDSVTIYANCLKNIIAMYQTTYELLKEGGKLFSILFGTETTGYGTGIQLEENTFRNIEKGGLAGRGTAHFFKREELQDIVKKVGFRNIVIDTMKYTDCGNVIEQFMIQAEK